ncbi:MAG: nitronate monooxygenase [Gemmatimonadota bacterium]
MLLDVLMQPELGEAPRSTPLPQVIQGGMGVGISSWQLARTVSRAGQLGVVSGTAIDSLLVRRLQDGDVGGDLRRAMDHFPIPGVAARVLARHFLPDGRGENVPYKMLSMYRLGASRERELVTVLAAFVEVFLAKEGHDGLVGINLLTKVQLPNPAALYGAMLAGVGYVLMGAGIPREIPALLDALARHHPVALRLEISQPHEADVPLIRFDPAAFWPDALPAPLLRPQFLAIVSSHSLATMLARKASGRVDGFVLERATAGGHNAPPRGPLQLTEDGQPVYGARDDVDFAELNALGLPWWLAGSAGNPAALADALALGAAGIQVGTLFAFCDESGLAEPLRARTLADATADRLEVFTDPRASPTGYPFKVVRFTDEPDPAVRERVCDLGYLRTAYRRPDGRIGYRCPSEPVAAYVEKGGREEDTVGRRCLCNALLANTGHAQHRGEGVVEAPLLTSGDDLMIMRQFLQGRARYSALDVLEYLGCPLPAAR